MVNSKGMVMRKLIVISLIFEFLAVAGVALLIYTAEPSGSGSSAIPHLGAPYSLQEDVIRTSHRLQTALDKVRWGIITMMLVSMVAQIAYLILDDNNKRMSG